MSQNPQSTPNSGAESALSRVRAAALALPEVTEADATFFVAGERFAQVERDGLSVRSDAATGWERLELAGEIDWALIEDRIARGWELTAPASLLEAGGR